DQEKFKTCDAQSGIGCGAGEQCVNHFRLARVLGPCATPVPGQSAGYACQVFSCTNSGNPCSTTSDCPLNDTCDVNSKVGDGQCYSNQCIQPPTGRLVDSQGAPAKIAVEALPPACRAYPEPDSPFPSMPLVNDWNEQGTATELRDDTAKITQPGFQNVKLCGNGEACECTYRKATYAGQTRYYSDNDALPLKGICSGGKNPGRFCENDDDCKKKPDGTIDDKGPFGTCQLLERVDRFIGLPGFCLELDQAQSVNGTSDKNPCLTWLPIDQMAGTQSLYNQYVKASFSGYVQPGNEWYCSDSVLTDQDYVGYEFGSRGGPKIDLHWSSDRDFLFEYFGEPAHNVQDCDKNTASCISSAHRHYNEDNDCKDAGSGMWCLWPQRLCPKTTWSEEQAIGTEEFCRRKENNMGPNNDAGIRLKSQAVQHPTFFTWSTAPSPPGVEETAANGGSPEKGANFFGCYEIADKGSLNDSRIHFPWLGQPIYKWQVELFDITLRKAEDGDSDEGPCEEFTGEGDDDEFGSRVLTFPSDWEPKTENSNALISNADSAINFYPIWDKDTATGRLIGIGVQAWDDSDSLAFYVDGLAIYFWPACYAAARVGGDSEAAYTDRLLGRIRTYPDPARINRDTEHKPWGAVCQFDDGALIEGKIDKEDDDKSLTLIIDQPGETAAMCPNDTDALYRNAIEGGVDYSLRQYFARSNQTVLLEGVVDRQSQVVDLDKRNLKYGVNDATAEQAGLLWDDTETADGAGAKAPEVHPVGECTSPNKCDEITDRSGMTVNGQYFGDAGGKIQMRANMKFFMHADKNRMPISELAIDWGDDSVKLDQFGKFLNHRESCDLTEFGFTADSCTTAPVEISHDYKCSAKILDRLPPCEGGRPNRISGYQDGGEGGCRATIEGRDRCVYVPRVMVKDNWGWCTTENSCIGAPGESGCYDGSKNTVTQPQPKINECRIIFPNNNNPNKDPWIYFDGRIVVEP
ncbi:MAG: hypothetical protein Q8P82_01135, partial [bacterium]|nr:hypothetical protein [bacterium]